MIKADKIFINGNIYTMEEEDQRISAFAVLNGRIAAVGTDEEIRSIPAGEIVDLEEKTVLPGFSDTHCHVEQIVESYRKVNLERAESIQDIIDLLKEGLPEVGENGWLNGYQMNYLNLKEKRIPDRYDLDQVSTEIPIFISNICIHNFAANSKALELAGIGRGFHEAEYEYIEFDEDGEPTGRFRENNALKYLFEKMPPLIADERALLDTLEEALLDFARDGITTVHSFGDGNPKKLNQPEPYLKLENHGRLPVRVILNNEPGANRPDGVISGTGCQKVQYGAVKYFADGSLSNRSAYLRESYVGGDPQFGLKIHDDEEWEASLRNDYENENDIAIHIIGDGAMEQVLNIIEKILKQSRVSDQHACYHPERQRQFRLIHCTYTTPEQWDRIAELDQVIIDSQPAFIESMGQLGTLRLGEERSKNLLAFKSWFDRGIIVTGGDDAPICTHNPFAAIRYAVLRETSEGEILNKDERISVYQAVSMYTKNAAYCAHEETVKGTISAGKLADFIVIDRDIFKISPDKIDEIKVLETYLGGDSVFKAEQYS